MKNLPPISRTFTTVVARSYKITIPFEMRRLLGITPKDYVTLYISVLLRQGERVVPIEHISKTQRTFSKLVYRDNKVSLPTELVRMLSIREGDYLTATIIDVTKPREVAENVEPAED